MKEEANEDFVVEVLNSVKDKDVTFVKGVVDMWKTREDLLVWSVIAHRCACSFPFSFPLKFMLFICACGYLC